MNFFHSMTFVNGFSCLGVMVRVAGGVLRDILLNRVPVILEKEIYASAALIAALIVV